MKSAWTQIEKQLNDSITVKHAVAQIMRRIRGGKNGTFHGGTLFHRKVLPIAFIILPKTWRNLFIRKWYRLD